MPVSKLISADTKILQDGTVLGTVHYVKDFSGFSDIPDEQSGYYFPLRLSAKGSKMTLKKNGTVVEGRTNIDFDSDIIFRLEDKNTVVSVEVDQKEVIKLAFTKATFDPKS